MPASMVINRRCANEISPLILFAIGIFICILCYQVDKLDNWLPDAVDEIQAGSQNFSAVRAFNDLKKLTDIGPKVAGSDECVKAEIMILSRLNKIRLNGKQEVLVERQQATGHYWLGFSTGFINSYSNAVNVVAMLVGSKGNESASLLLNCHYDSVPESPGASDDIISCAAMLEILTVLSQQDEPLRHNIVFLFNGAEENPLQASHAFITQHKWAKNISAFINLEAAGMGGRECLFQAGPGRGFLVETYQNSAPYPHAQVLAEELFQSGVIPSDTDFRVFRDFADIPGLDMAFSRYGQVYHTKYDKASLVPIGSLQRMGDNVLALSKSLANSEHLDIKQPRDDRTNMVYFDYFGYFMVAISAKTAWIINCAVVAFAVATAYPQIRRISKTKSGLGEIISCVGSIICSGAITFFFASCILPYLISFGSRLTGGFLMKWYSRHWLVIPLYCLPIIAVYLATSISFDIWRSPTTSITIIERAKLHLAMSQICWSLLIAIILMFASRVAYVLTVPLFITSLSALLFNNIFTKDNYWFYAKLPLLAVNLMWSLQYFLLMSGLILPILGRSGASMNPEMIVSIMCFGFLTYMSMGFSGLEILISHSKRSMGILSSSLVAILIAMTILILIPINPYKVGERPSPQRYLIMHTMRNFYDGQNSSGYWISNLDINSPATIIKPTGVKNLVHGCQDDHLGCGFPLYTSRTKAVSYFSTWIEAAPPSVTRSTLVEQSRTCSRRTCNIVYKIKGPQHMSLLISPMNNVSISAFGVNATETPSWYFKGRPVLMVYHTSGTQSHEWTLDLTAYLPENQSPKEPFLEMALSGHLTFHNEYQTQSFKEFLSKFPEWIHVTSFLSSYESLIV